MRDRRDPAAGVAVTASGRGAEPSTLPMFSTGPRFIMTVAAWHSARRRLASPALVMPPETSRFPDWRREGVRPARDPTFFDDLNRAGSSIADRKVNATTAPVPGISR